MDRKEFIQLVVLGTAAAATGCLSSCSNDPEPTTAGASGVDFTLDLTAAANAALAAGTGYVYGANNQVIVAKTSAGTYVAVQAPCTHEGTQITFDVNRQQFQCPRHQATFSPSGAVQSGPAPAPLKQYTVAQTGNTLRITG